MSAIPDAWEIWTPERIYEPLPPIQWLVEGLIPRGTLGMIAAYGSGIKTWAEIDLLDAIARGRKWLGLFPCAQGHAFLIDYENGAYEVRRRLQALARKEPGKPASPAEGISFVTMPPTSMHDVTLIERLEPIAEGANLIAVDTLAAGSPGVDENDARFAAPLNRLKGLAERSGAAIVVLHHTRKSGGRGSPRGGGDDERETTRGTSAIFNALDWEIKLSRSREDETLSTVKQTKSRFSRGVRPFAVRVEDIGERAEAGQEAVRVCGEWLEEGALDADASAKRAAEERQLEKLSETILALLKKSPGLGGERGVRDALREAKAHFANKDLGPALLRLKQTGRVENRGADARPRLHAVGERRR